MERRGDYGYDAPYALVMFAAVGGAAAVGVIASLWSGQDGRLAAKMGFLSAFCAATNASSTWDADAAPF
jgi:hypothetical protein